MQCGYKEKEKGNGDVKFGISQILIFKIFNANDDPYRKNDKYQDK